MNINILGSKLSNTIENGKNVKIVYAFLNFLYFFDFPYFYMILYIILDIKPQDPERPRMRKTPHGAPGAVVSYDLHAI